jgi:hypothetical protein
MRRIAGAGALVLLGFGLPGPVGCADLPALTAGTCGNGVVDGVVTTESGEASPGTEDCDGFTTAPGVTCGGGQAGSGGSAGLPCRCAAPGTAHPCRFEWDANTACPDGWGQGLDGVCRQPTPTFLPLGGPLATGSNQALLADFDGDGRDDIVSLGVADVLGNRPVRFHFLETTGTVQKVVTVPSLLGAPLVSHLSSETRSDLVFGFNGGLGVLAGQIDQTVVPIAFPTITFQNGGIAGDVLAFPVRFADNPALRQVMVLTPLPTSTGGIQEGLIRDTREEKTAETCQDTSSPAVIYGFSPPTGFTDLLSAYAIGGLVDGAKGALCDRVALAFASEPQVFVVSPCKENLNGKGEVPWNDANPSPPIVIPLPAAASVTHLFYADADGDKRLDLIIGTADHTFVTYGVADGSFSSVAGAKTGDNQVTELNHHEFCPTGNGPMTMMAACGCGGTATVSDACARPSPLAVADLNKDGVIDFVSSTQVLLSEKGSVGGKTMTVYRSHYDKIGGQWTEAVVADFSGDGWPDVVAAQSSPSIDVLVSSNGDNDAAIIFNHSSLPTTAPASLLAVGDLDGDQLPDISCKIAGVTTTDDSGSGGASGAGGTTGTSAAFGDSLGVAFGQLNRPLTAPASLGQLGLISQVLAGPLADRTLVGVDTLADIGVASKNQSGGASRFSILYGDSSRELIAPLALSLFPCPVRGTAAATVVGKFTSDSLRDVVALGLDPKKLAPPGKADPTLDEGARLWLFSGSTEGLLAAPTASEGTAATLGMQFGISDNRGMTATDTDVRGGHLGALLAAGNLDGDDLDEIVLIAPTDDNNSRILVWKATPVAGKDSFTVLGTPLDIGKSVVGNSQAALLDVDGNGTRDLLLLAADRNGNSELMVFWGDGQGNLATTPVTIPVSLGKTSPQGFALINATAKKQPDLLVVSDSSAALLTLGLGPQAVPTPNADFARDNTLSGSSVVVGDITGDGIDDVVVTRDTGIQVFEGKPRLK